MTFYVSPCAHLDLRAPKLAAGGLVIALVARGCDAPRPLAFWYRSCSVACIVDVSRFALPRLPLSRIQGIVGLAAGLLSIAGFLFSATQTYLGAAPGSGEVVTLVRDAKSDRAVSDATVEILTPDNAIVTTVKPDASGAARYSLKEGPYRVRVTHPRYAAEVRQVQVSSGQRAEVRVSIRPSTRGGSGSPFEQAGRAVDEGFGALKRVFTQ
jgi:hypothetical protein